MTRALAIGLAAGVLALVSPFRAASQERRSEALLGSVPRRGFDDVVEANVQRLLDEGRQIFRHDTFGDEDFWGGKLRLHEAIAGAAHGGVGPGVSPATALAVGLKVGSRRSRARSERSSVAARPTSAIRRRRSCSSSSTPSSA